MGVPWDDCVSVGQLLGKKLVINEFVAYMDLSELIKEGSRVISPRSEAISTYALCGFANFSSIAIQLGGIGGIAPSRREDLAKLGIKSLIGGTLACFMTACVAGLML
jgi:CNT family concentrative nucleoside transporter